MNRNDIYVARFSASGVILGAERYGDVLDDSLFDVVSDEGGNSYLVGAGYNQVSFGGDALDLGSTEMSFAVALGPALSPLWQKTIDGPGRTYAQRALLHGARLVVAGESFGDGDLRYDSESFGEGRFFVLGIDSTDGSLLRGDAYDPLSSSGRLQALGLAPNGDVVIGGIVNPPADFGGGETTTPFTNQPFIARFTPGGELSWSTLFCTEKGAGIVAVGHGNDSVVAVLQFSGGGVLELGSDQITRGGALRLDMSAGR